MSQSNHVPTVGRFDRAPLQTGSRQRGAVLVVGLVFLVILTLLGISAMNVATLEERIAGNLRDRNVALQAADAALRYAERYIVANVSGLTGFNTACNGGLCYAGRGRAPTNAYWLDSAMFTDAKTIVYGCAATASPHDDDCGGAAPEVAIAGVSRQPRFIVEGFPKQFPGGSNSDVFVYRITVEARGGSENTVVRLQETYMP